MKKKLTLTLALAIVCIIGFNRFGRHAQEAGAQTEVMPAPNASVVAIENKPRKVTFVVAPVLSDKPISSENK